MVSVNDFEKIVDASLEADPQWNQPAPTILGRAYLIADAAINGGRFARSSPPDLDRGHIILSRLSYIARFLRNCPISTINQPKIPLDISPEYMGFIRKILDYGHLCEVMPQYRRGIYVGEEIGDNHIKLALADADVEKFEAEDIIMSELSIPFDLDHIPDGIQVIKDIYKSRFSIPAMRGDMIRRIYGLYKNVLHEDPLLSDAVFSLAFGFSRDEFRMVRDSLSALGGFYSAASIALEKAANETAGAMQNFFGQSVVDLAVPWLTQEEFIGIIRDVTGVDDDKILSIIDAFLIDSEERAYGKARDGFMPPLLKNKDSIMFSPYALRLMLSERNLIHSLHQRDITSFNNTVSSDLEPTLLEQAEKVFSRIKEYIIVKNIKWSDSEIDLLVYDLRENTALHVQAKASLPPQGARMTGQIDDSTRKAIRQLDRFDALSQSDKDNIVMSRIPCARENITFIPVILSRSRFGTAKVWSRMGKAIPLNLPLLRGVIGYISKSKSTKISSFVRRAIAQRAEVLAIAKPKWETDSTSFYGISLETPSLVMDQDKLIRARYKLNASLFGNG